MKKVVLLLIVGLVFVFNNVEAASESHFVDVCQLNQPAWVVFNDGSGPNYVDGSELWSVTGVQRVETNGVYIGFLRWHDVYGNDDYIALRYVPATARPWSVACPNGANMRLSSYTLDYAAFGGAP